MTKVEVSAERTIDALATTVYGYLANLHVHERFLPAAFSGFEVESGGIGAGSVVRFKVRAGGRERDFRMKMDEPEPGRVITETDTNSSLVTTFTVTPQDDGSRVRIFTTWEGAGGIGGVFERLFAPRAMREIYVEELDRLNDYAREQRPSGSG